jgi:outer membrane protein
MKITTDLLKFETQFLSRVAIGLLFLFGMNFPKLKAQDKNSKPSHEMFLKPSDVLDLAIKNSKVLKISQAQVMVAQARLAQSNDRNLPFVGVNGSYYRFIKPEVSVSNELTNLLKGSNGSTSGATSPAAFPSLTEATLIQASVSENLFSGFKNRYTIEADQYLVNAATLKVNASQDEVAFNALSAYYNIFKLKQNQILLSQDLNEQNRRVQDFENLEKNGLLTRNDLLKAKVGASNIKLTILEIQNGLEIATYNFKIMLGIPESDSFSLDTLQIFKDRTLKSKEELIQFALDHRFDLLSIHQENESYKSRIKSAKSGFYPSISINGGFVDAFLPGLITLKNVFDGSIGLKYNLTGLFTTHHMVEEAKANFNASMNQYQESADQIRMTVNKNYLTFLEIQKRIDIDQERIEQGVENYKILKNKYENSLATLTDLLEAELNLLQARLQQINAKADAQVAYFTLLKNAGISITKDLMN